MYLDYIHSSFTPSSSSAPTQNLLKFKSSSTLLLLTISLIQFWLPIVRAKVNLQDPLTQGQITFLKCWWLCFLGNNKPHMLAPINKFVCMVCVWMDVGGRYIGRKFIRKYACLWLYLMAKMMAVWFCLFKLLQKHDLSTFPEKPGMDLPRLHHPGVYLIKPCFKFRLKLWNCFFFFSWDCQV